MKADTTARPILVASKPKATAPKGAAMTAPANRKVQ
jgi:hypothetical protein